MHQLLKESYGYLFEDPLLEEMAKVGKYKKFKADEILMEIGETIKFIAHPFKRCHQDHAGR